MVTQVPYKTMTLAEICALPVDDLADNDAHLYLWAINSLLPQAYDVAKAWGFKPSGARLREGLGWAARS